MLSRSSSCVARIVPTIRPRSCAGAAPDESTHLCIAREIVMRRERRCTTRRVIHIALIIFWEGRCRGMRVRSSRQRRGGTPQASGRRWRCRRGSRRLRWSGPSGFTPTRREATCSRCSLVRSPCRCCVASGPVAGSSIPCIGRSFGPASQEIRICPVSSCRGDRSCRGPAPGQSASISATVSSVVHSALAMYRKLMIAAR